VEHDLLSKIIQNHNVGYNYICSKSIPDLQYSQTAKYFHKIAMQKIQTHIIIYHGSIKHNLLTNLTFVYTKTQMILLDDHKLWGMGGACCIHFNFSCCTTGYDLVIKAKK